MKRFLIVSLCISFSAFGMDWQASAQNRAVAELKESNEKEPGELLKLLKEQVEWNKQTTAKLGELQEAIAAQEKKSEERDEVAFQNQATLFLLAPVLYYCAHETLKNLALFL
jgi:hypothetical protein